MRDLKQLEHVLRKELYANIEKTATILQDMQSSE
jgi:hypothetical protein